MRVLELYSGIGGMHLALKESNIQGEVVASIDINPTANAVYRHNFPNTPLLNRNIESLSSKYINDLKIDTILMSPPCQPFTRNGLKGDVKDARTKSFLHILEVLPQLEVRYILIENVKGFETSEMRDRLIQALETSKFVYQEFILNPLQLGVPNSRTRYYCIARKGCEEFPFKIPGMMESFPHVPADKASCNGSITIADILEDDANVGDYYIPVELLQKRVMALDVCHRDSTHSCCFTKSYGRYVTGTGSVFTNKTKEKFDLMYKELEDYEEGSQGYLECTQRLQLRFFTPREVCRLMNFPEMFTFPKSVKNKQIYMLLGNSINVRVVSELIKVLFT